MAMLRAGALLLLGATVSAENMVKADNSDVHPVNEATWSELFKGEDEWAVEFYAPWCGHCKALAPAWEKLATEVGGSTPVKFAKIDATSNAAKATEFGVKTYPQIFYMKGDYTMAGSRKYKGARTFDGIEKYITKIIGPDMPLVDESSVEDFNANNDVTYVLISDKDDKYTAQFGALATQYKDDLYLAKATKTDEVVKLIVAEGTKGPASLPAVAAVLRDDSDRELTQWHYPADENGLEDFIKAHQFPIMAVLDKTNFFATVNAGKKTLLAIVDPSKSEEYREMLETVARANVYDLHSGYVDGKEWSKYVKEKFMVSKDMMTEGTVIVFDGPKQLFYHNHSIVRTAEGVQALIAQALSGKMQPTKTERGMTKAAKKKMNEVLVWLEDQPMYVTGGAVLVLVLLLTWLFVLPGAEPTKLE